jgi:hypothetical protein
MACFALCGMAHGQRAALSGSVSDQDGSVIPGVRITLLNLDQGLKREASTNQDGYFSVPFLQPGNYLVTAQKEGFAVAEVKDVILHVGDVRGLSIRLVVSAAPVQIEVSGKAQPVETVSPALGKVVTGDVVRNAPLDGRDIRDLALLQPGVTPADLDFLGAGSFDIAGNRGDSINYLLDGGLNNDLVDNRTVYSPNPDTVAEFHILTSNYPAEYGRNSGGVITVATQSGTNQFHGGAFDFSRNDALDANSFFNKLNGLPRNILKRNQFGGTLGGPLTIPKVVNGKDRYFFFVGYQGERQIQDLVQHDVPTFTPAELGGDFSHSGPGGSVDTGVATFLKDFPFFQPDPAQAALAIIDPTRINSVAQNYIAAGLIPASADGFLNSQERFTSNRDELTTKFDFDLRATDKLAVTLGWDRTDQLTPFDYATVPGYPDASDFHDYFSNFAYTHIFSPNLLNELRMTAQRVSVNAENPAARLPTPTALGISVNPDLPSGPANLFFDVGLLTGFGINGPQRVTDNTFSYSDALTWTHGKHSWKFGGSFSAFQNSSFFSLAVNGQFVFAGSSGNSGSSTTSNNSFADFLLGLPAQYIQGPAAPSNIRSKFTSGFVQDDWRVRKNLVFSLGLRYEYSTPKTDTAGRTFSIVPGRQSQIFTDAPVGMLFPGDAAAPRGVNFPDKNDWAPRFGFAWDVKGDGKMSLRGAFGVFYDILKGEDNLQFNGKPPFFASAGFSFPALSGNPSSEPTFLSQPFAGMTNPFPSHPPAPDINFADAGFLPIGGSNNLFVVAPHLRTPYTYQYHLTFEREVAQNTVVEASYVGSSSHGLTGLVDINPFVLGTFDRTLNLPPGNASCASDTASQCSFAQVREFRNATNASYNSLLLSLQKQMSDGGIFGRSYFTLAYTYSHNIDNASGFANRNFEVPYYQPNLFRASSDMDVTHRIVFSGGWEVPFERAWSSGPKRVTKGWSVFPIVSWRSGFPVDVFANLASAFDFTSPGPSGVGDANMVRANLIGPIRISDPRSQGNFYFDPRSFSTAQCDSTDCQPGPAIFPTDAQAVADPAVRTYGTLPRNFFRGPGQFNINLAFSKTTPLTERVHLEARADFFNLLNHAEFINPNTNIADPNFGKIQFTYQPRIIQLALRLSF